VKSNEESSEKLDQNDENWSENNFSDHVIKRKSYSASVEEDLEESYSCSQSNSPAKNKRKQKVARKKSLQQEEISPHMRVPINTCFKPQIATSSSSSPIDYFDDIIRSNNDSFQIRTLSNQELGIAEPDDRIKGLYQSSNISVG